ncbi:MAG: hypothetical protein AAGD25_19165 [Cyanobacteria bacterium P01_F01_bin.150]
MKSSKLPVQSAPVDRYITGAAMAGENGVDASGFLDILKSVGSAVAPVALDAIKGLIQ